MQILCQYMGRSIFACGRVDKWGWVILSTCYHLQQVIAQEMAGIEAKSYSISISAEIYQVFLR